jgi:hypothetical protein
MVDAADKKGKYQPKQRQFMPDGTQDPQNVLRIDLNEVASGSKVGLMCI